MRLRGNQMCQCILILLAIFLVYQIVCSCNKNAQKGGAENAPVEQEQPKEEPVVESDTEVESDSELDFNDPDYYNYEQVANDNADEESSENVAPASNAVAEVAEVVEEKATPTAEFNITGLEDSDKYHMLASTEKLIDSKKTKLNPSELLPADSKDMQGNNFLTASLSKSEQIIGVPTQTQRSRKNYDIRSAPANPQVEVSPWNMSTMEPDTGRLTFEIGTTHCPPCE